MKSCDRRGRICLDIKILVIKLSRVADTSGTHLWLVLMKAHRSLARHASRSVEGLEMCFSDFAVLELLLHHGAQPVSTIGRRVDLTTGSITTAVDRLEARGLVVRTLDASDRRVRTVSLTKKGKEKIAAAFAQHKRAMDKACSGLTESERATLTTLVKKLGKSAEEVWRATHEES